MQDTCCGKTSQELSVQTVAMTLPIFLALWSAGGAFIPRPTDGKIRESAFQQMGVELRNGVCLTLNTLEFPNDVRRIFVLLDTGAWWSRQPFLFEQDGCAGILRSGDEGESACRRN